MGGGETSKQAGCSIHSMYHHVSGMMQTGQLTGFALRPCVIIQCFLLVTNKQEAKLLSTQILAQFYQVNPHFRYKCIESAIFQSSWHDVRKGGVISHTFDWSSPFYFSLLMIYLMNAYFFVCFYFLSVNENFLTFSWHLFTMQSYSVIVLLKLVFNNNINSILSIFWVRRSSLFSDSLSDSHCTVSFNPLTILTDSDINLKCVTLGPTWHRSRSKSYTFGSLWLTLVLEYRQSLPS